MRIGKCKSLLEWKLLFWNIKEEDSDKSVASEATGLKNRDNPSHKLK
jgi:hypothetical protein